MPRPDTLTLGRVTKAHGIRGEVRVVLYADDWTPFRGLTRCLVGRKGGPFQPYAIETERDHGRAIVLKLAGIDTPAAAAALIGSEIAIPRAEAPPPPEDTFYHYDILGLEVAAGGRVLGEVQEILETAGHDVYVVQGASGEWLLPATRVLIRRIDLAAGRIELDPTVDLSGLLAGGQPGETDAESV
jgi:16S rRNA processing protein RimM